MALTKEQIAAELIRRGVPPQRLAQAGYGQIARQGETGLIAPPLEAPDPVAARQAYGKDYGMLRDAREAVGRIGPVDSQLERFQQLNQEQRTGGIQHQSYEGLEVANPFNWAGMIGEQFARYDPEIKGMSGIASELQGKARPPGSGATSDFEQRLYRQGVPSPDKPGPVNDDIITYMRSTMSEENDRLAFQEEFLRRNGTLSGAPQAWTRYLKANPYAVADGARYKPNTGRQSWDEYFGVRQTLRDKSRATAEDAWKKRLGTLSSPNARGLSFEQFWDSYSRENFDERGRPKPGRPGGPKPAAAKPAKPAPGSKPAPSKGYRVLSVE
jgi:hypothetical protein